jgi:hypothetical protein
MTVFPVQLTLTCVLLPVKSLILARSANQFIMCSLLHNLTMIEDQDFIGSGGRAETVSNNKRSAAGQIFF